MEITALDLVNKAIELGFDKCGIIQVQRMRDYEERLEERMEHFPQTKDKYESFRSFAHLQNDYSFSKAIVVVSFWYGKYYIPNNLQNYVAKYYLTDGRRNPNSEGYQTSTRFEKYLMDCGFQTATDRDFGITALRWAGMKAGIGIIRKNNFFYTEKGSYQYLEAFLIDQPLQYIPLPSTAPTAPSSTMVRRSAVKHWTTTLMCLALTPITSPSTDRCKSA